MIRFWQPPGATKYSSTLEESPYRILIEERPLLGLMCYICKLHPEAWFIDIAGIEHHIMIRPGRP